MTHRRFGRKEMSPLPGNGITAAIKIAKTCRFILLMFRCFGDLSPHTKGVSGPRKRKKA